MNNKKCQFLKVAVSLFILSSYVQAENLVKDGSMEELSLEDVSSWKLISSTTHVEKVKEGANTVLHIVTKKEDASDDKIKHAGVMQFLGDIKRPTSLKVSFRYKVVEGKGFGVAVGNTRFEKRELGLRATDWEKFEHIFDLAEIEEIKNNTVIYFMQELEHPTEFYLDDVSVEVLKN